MTSVPQPEPFDPSGASRMVLIGDSHANGRWLHAMIRETARRDAHHAIVLGDFGFWPRSGTGRAFLDSVEQAGARFGVQVAFLDGNHEDHEVLARLPLDQRLQHRLSAHLTYLGRGARFSFGGRVFVTVGGAVSVDRQLRNPGLDWFPGEQLTSGQAGAVVAGGPADVMLSHDAPFGTPTLYAAYEQHLDPVLRRASWPVEVLADSDEHQRRLETVMNGLGVREVFHGHHHRCYSDVLDGVSVTGLDCDGGSFDRSCVLLEA